jgi:hypothetical protein
MDRFEYEITRHFMENAPSVVYFCNETGDCGLGDVNPKHTAAIVEILNERGKQGWALVQVIFGKDGLVAFWKRRITNP